MSMDRRKFMVGVTVAAAAPILPGEPHQDSFFRILRSDFPTPAEISARFADYIPVRLSRWAVDDDGSIYEDAGPL
jgi:hypothetical protein